MQRIYVSQEVAQDRSDLLQLVVPLLAAGLAATGSVLLDKVPTLPGLSFAALMMVGALYVQHRRMVLRRTLRSSAEVALESIRRLMAEEDE